LTKFAVMFLCSAPVTSAVWNRSGSLLLLASAHSSRLHALHFTPLSAGLEDRVVLDVARCGVCPHPASYCQLFDCSVSNFFFYMSNMCVI
jgi:hypothetical protein